MSFILDALRKSEIERQRQSGPGIAEFPVAREDKRLPIALIAIGFLLAVNLAVVLFFMLRDDREAAPTPARTEAASPPAPAARAPEPAAAPLAAAPSALASQVPPAEEPPAVYYEAPATQPPDAPDPTLVPESGLDGGRVTYGDPPPPAADAAAIAAATGLPELAIDLHIFAGDPAKRAVFINGRRYTQGATIAEGPVVEEITRDGAVLSYRGRRFLLPRL
jgi:general secretion pathway protein B